MSDKYFYFHTNGFSVNRNNNNSTKIFRFGKCYSVYYVISFDQSSNNYDVTSILIM